MDLAEGHPERPEPVTKGVLVTACPDPQQPAVVLTATSRGVGLSTAACGGLTCSAQAWVTCPPEGPLVRSRPTVPCARVCVVSQDGRAKPHFKFTEIDDPDRVDAAHGSRYSLAGSCTPARSLSRNSKSRSSQMASASSSANAEA